MLNHEIVKVVDSYITSKYLFNPELKRFLLNHERKHLLINNLTREIKIAQTRTKIIFNVDERNQIIKDFAKMFCNSAIMYKDDQNKSKNQLAMDQFKRQHLSSDLDKEPELPEGVTVVERPRHLTTIDS